MKPKIKPFTIENATLEQMQEYIKHYMSCVKQTSRFKETNRLLWNQMVKQLPFISDIVNATPRQLFYHILNEQWVAPSCKMCSSSVTFNNSGIYNTYCSSLCQNNDSVVKNKSKMTKNNKIW